MNYEQFKKSAQHHVSTWIRNLYPNLEMGVYNSKHGSVPHPHILPLSSYKKGSRKDAVIEAIDRYKILTDGVILNFKEFPKKELHPLANHLTSSQMLCYNFFRLLLQEETQHYREIKITQELIDWLGLSFPNLPKVSNAARCIFEYTFDTEEGTSCDFCIKDSLLTIFFEIKYTENGFGVAPNDTPHQNKFVEIYEELLLNQDTVKQYMECKEFFNNYQLFRNAIRTNENTYFVVIYPRHNTVCCDEFNAFIKNYVVHPERILSLDWETAFQNSNITANSELKNKYGL